MSWRSTANPITKITVLQAQRQGDEDRGNEGQDRSDQRHGFEQTRENGEGQDVRQSDQRVAECRRRPDGQHRQPFTAHEAAELGLDLVPDVERARASLDREQ